MMRILPLIFLLLMQVSAGAAPLCSALFERKSAVEFLEELNSTYSEAFYKETPDENIQKSFYLAKKYKLFRLKRMFKSLEKKGQGFDAYDLSQFVFKLDRLAFADTVLNDPNLSAKMSGRDLQILSEARRKVLSEGIIKYFEIDQQKSGFWKKSMKYLGEAVSWKYWRWTQAMFYMPKLVGTSLPPELAKKILLEGLDAHRAEVERYIPAIKTRSYFNSFSRFYNTAVLVSLLTVVPYVTHNYYVEQVRVGEANAAQMLEPLVKTSEDLARVNYLEQKEVGALEKYIAAYTEKYGQPPSEAQVTQARLAIHAKILADADADGDSGQH